MGLPRPKKMTKTAREILKEFVIAKVERREPAPRTIGNAVTNKWLRRLGNNEEGFPIYELTEKGKEAIAASEPDQGKSSG